MQEMYQYGISSHNTCCRASTTLWYEQEVYCWILHGEGDLNEVVRDDNDTEDDSDAAGLVEHSGIGELLDNLHQDACSNVRMSTTVSKSNFDHEHNICLR